MNAFILPRATEAHRCYHNICHQNNVYFNSIVKLSMPYSVLVCNNRTNKDIPSKNITYLPATLACQSINLESEIITVYEVPDTATEHFF